MYEEKINELIDNDKYLLEEPFELKGFGIAVPTNYLYLELNFPEGYSFTDAHFDVFIGYNYKSSSRVQNEILRIKQDVGFKEECFLNKSKLVLSVENPQLGNTYLISWKPPIRNDYEKILLS